MEQLLTLLAEKEGLLAPLSLVRASPFEPFFLRYGSHPSL